jgi:glycosyltransferase involved in cell wall biosynthesis
LTLLAHRVRPPAGFRQRQVKHTAPSLLIVRHAPYPIGQPRTERLALAAMEAGWSVEVLSLRRTGEPLRERVDGIQIRRLPLSHRRGASVLMAALEYLAFTGLASMLVVRRLLHSRPFDVLSVSTPPDFLMVAALVPRLAGKRIVLDNNDPSPLMWDSRYAHLPGARVVTRALQVVERVGCAIAHEVVAVHDRCAHELASNGTPERKLTVVMNSSDPARTAKARASRRPGVREQFVVAYHGTVTPAYGVGLLVEALAKARHDVRGLRALVLGDGDGLPIARERASALGLQNVIRFSGGYLPHQDALACVAGAHCGVIPNLPNALNQLALSTKLLEYVALGIPAVVARLETLAAHFTDDEVTFFHPGDAESLAEAITWVSRSPAEASERAERALRRYEASYSWPEQRGRWLNVLAAGEAGAHDTSW